MENDSGKTLRIFLDSSVVLAASMSLLGASHEVFHYAGYQNWSLIVSPYVLREVKNNLRDKPTRFAARFIPLQMMLELEDDELAFDWPVMFERSKDKPVLFSALACADVLLTLIGLARLRRNARPNSLRFAGVETGRLPARGKEIWPVATGQPSLKRLQTALPKPM